MAKYVIYCKYKNGAVQVVYANTKLGVWWGKRKLRALGGNIVSLEVFKVR